MSKTTVRDVPTDHAPPAAARTAGGSRALALLLVITGAAGLLAAWVITIDKFKLLEDPNFTPGVQPEPGRVLRQHHEERPGVRLRVPQPDAGPGRLRRRDLRRREPARRRPLPPLVLADFNAGTLFGVGFCTWLQYQSLYRINSLCLWCCLAWVATIVMFWYVTSFNIRNGFLPAPALGEELPRRVHLGPAGAAHRRHRHADPDPLVGLLDQLTRCRAGLSAA